MKGFIEKSDKYRKKWFCTSQYISCPLVILSSFTENCFPQIPIIVSTRRNIAPTKKKTLFLLDRKSFSITQVKDLLENKENLPQLEEISEKTEKKLVSTNRNMVRL